MRCRDKTTTAAAHYPTAAVSSITSPAYFFAPVVDILPPEPAAMASSSVDPRKAGIESASYPILCAPCLGPNPLVRMLQDAWGRPCKVCERPFATFRWRPSGAGTRYKTTQVCGTCARVKNVCQTCVLDLAYGLPVQVRDAAMAAADVLGARAPASEAGRGYAAKEAERAVGEGAVDRVYAEPVRALERVRRPAPEERNLAQLCTWFAKGKCARGVYCQYRHEMPKEKGHPMADQNIVDRYYGVNDPVAASIMARSAGGRPGGVAPPPPEDEAVMSLFIGGVTKAVTEQVLRALFQTHAAGVESVRVLGEKGIAFVDFKDREAAEAAVADKHGTVQVADARLSIKWAKGGGGRGKRAPPRPAAAAAGAKPSVFPSFVDTPALVSMAGIIPGVQAPPGTAAAPAKSAPDRWSTTGVAQTAAPPSGGALSKSAPDRESDAGEPQAKKRRGE